MPIRLILQKAMQEQLAQNNLSSPAVTSAERIKKDIDTFGYCREATKQQIIDEEKTHAAEILSSVSLSADIPRIYKTINGDAVDKFGVSLNTVLNNGIKYLEDNSFNWEGAEWELQRRKIEQKNLHESILMPAGIVSVEISATDYTKPENQRLKFGYGGDTLVRINFKKNDSELVQRNIMVKTSDLKRINQLRKLVDSSAENIQSAEEALSKMIYVSATEASVNNLVTKVINFATAQHSNLKPASYLLSIIKRCKKQTVNSWEFINQNDEVFEAMFMEMQKKATSYICDDCINDIRVGGWQILLDRFNNQNDSDKEVSVTNGLMKAKAIGAVFTSCGGTIGFDEDSFSKLGGSNYFGRYEVVSMLMGRVNDNGPCQSCGTNGLLYGCGVYCRSCNLVWCQEYLESGRQLSDNEISWRKYFYYYY